MYALSHTVLIIVAVVYPITSTVSVYLLTPDAEPTCLGWFDHLLLAVSRQVRLARGLGEAIAQSDPYRWWRTLSLAFEKKYRPIVDVVSEDAKEEEGGRIGPIPAH